ncbi:hypothetical protein E4U12_002971 [Claviceps purpurea]|nr:hypothetical protein E4U12_002971 [Claviceps purpurea]
MGLDNAGGTRCVESSLQGASVCDVSRDASLVCWSMTGSGLRVCGIRRISGGAWGPA